MYADLQYDVAELLDVHGRAPPAVSANVVSAPSHILATTRIGLDQGSSPRLNGQSVTSESTTGVSCTPITPPAL